MATKPQLKVLERVFGCEIEGGFFQSRETKAVLECLEEGYIERRERKELTPIGYMTVKYFDLTHLGRLMYCSSCEEPPK